MAETNGIALDTLRILVEQAGLRLSDTELTQMQAMYDFYREDVQALHELDLGMDDLAVTFPPQWDPES